MRHLLERALGRIQDTLDYVGNKPTFAGNNALFLAKVDIEAALAGIDLVHQAGDIVARHTSGAAPQPPCHRAGWPPELLKAIASPGDYACDVRSLGPVRIVGAEDAGNGWVRLIPFDDRAKPDDHFARLPYPFANGLTVRAADIQWVADRPCGPASSWPRRSRSASGVTNRSVSKPSQLSR